MEALLTLEELVAVVATRLEAEGITPGNGQVSSRPDARTIRYHATLGLLDRPVARRGRMALYGDRHIAQEMAVRRLQASGWPLAQIQRRLVGMPTSDLHNVRPDEPPPLTFVSDIEGTVAADHTVMAPPADLPRSREAFWAVRPATPPQDAPHQFVGLRLPGGAVLLLPGSRPLSAGDARALEAAAGPLLAEAARRTLIHHAQPESTDIPERD